MKTGSRLEDADKALEARADKFLQNLLEYNVDQPAAPASETRFVFLVIKPKLSSKARPADEVNNVRILARGSHKWSKID